MEDGMVSAIDALNELRDDNTVPKNVKIKIESIIGLLNEKTETIQEIQRTA